MDDEKENEMIWQRWLIFEEMKKKIVRYVEDDLYEKGETKVENKKQPELFSFLYFIS